MLFLACPIMSGLNNLLWSGLFINDLRYISVIFYSYEFDIRYCFFSSTLALQMVVTFKKCFFYLLQVVLVCYNKQHLLRLQFSQYSHFRFLQSHFNALADFHLNLNFFFFTKTRKLKPVDTLIWLTWWLSCDGQNSFSMHDYSRDIMLANAQTDMEANLKKMQLNQKVTIITRKKHRNK